MLQFAAGYWQLGVLGKVKQRGEALKKELIHPNALFSDESAHRLLNLVENAFLTQFTTDDGEEAFRITSKGSAALRWASNMPTEIEPADAFEFLTDDEDTYADGLPESFDILVKEMRSLSLNGDIPTKPDEKNVASHSSSTNQKAEREFLQQIFGVIETEPTDQTFPISKDDPRWGQLDAYAQSNPGQPISDYARNLFLNEGTSLSSSAPPLPTSAPEDWPMWKTHREGNESALEFATRVYKPWMDAGVLARTDIRSLDQNLYRSIETWFRNHPDKKAPDGFNLLKEGERNLSWAERVAAGEIDAPRDVAGARKLANQLKRIEKPSKAGQSK